jgi:ribonuclease BN (tRNA processing enzyme)
MAHAEKLAVFHFSPRYSGQADRLYREAQETFYSKNERVHEGESSV